MESGEWKDCGPWSDRSFRTEGVSEEGICAAVAEMVVLVRGEWGRSSGGHGR